MKKMLFLTLIILLVYNVNCFAISTMENEFDLYSGQHQSTCIDYKFPYIKELGVVHIQVENNGFHVFSLLGSTEPVFLKAGLHFFQNGKYWSGVSLTV